jgi:hypothetical protein
LQLLFFGKNFGKRRAKIDKLAHFTPIDKFVAKYRDFRCHGTAKTPRKSHFRAVRENAKTRKVTFLQFGPFSVFTPPGGEEKRGPFLDPPSFSRARENDASKNHTAIIFFRFAKK